jgi:hypothetical protein
MINQKALNDREIENIIRNMLKENSPINLASVDSYSRKNPSFYTLIYIKIYGKHDNNGAYFNKAGNLYSKITCE